MQNNHECLYTNFAMKHRPTQRVIRKIVNTIMPHWTNGVKIFPSNCIRILIHYSPRHTEILYELRLYRII